MAMVHACLSPMRRANGKVHQASSAIQAQRLLRLVPFVSLVVFFGVIFVQQERPPATQQQLQHLGRHRSSHILPMGNSTIADASTATHHKLTVMLDDALRQDVPLLQCPYMTFDDLTQADRLALSRDTGALTLVCCMTTAGPWNIVVHHSWAPHGAQRFLDMVQSGYFSLKVPLMRCVDRWICQFGLAGKRSEDWQVKIPDDPQWMTTPEYGNSEGKLYFKTGFFGYAGYGPKTRGRQFFVSLSDHNRLGEQLWEVPWGELIGAESFDTLKQIYKGYGEDGPDQYKMIEEGAHEYLLEKFPHIDYITSCQVVGSE